MKNNVLCYLEECAVSHPERIALGDEFQSVTYREYQENAQKIGTFLAKQYGVINRPVAVVIDRNITSIYTFLGVVYSGNMYVPLDAGMPRERIGLMLDTLKPIAILNATDLDDLPFESIKTKEILKDGTVDLPVLERIRMNVLDTDPLYAIFTSGSTGVPKGVSVSHKSVIDLIEAFQDAFAFEDGCVFGNQAPFDFDVSVKDIYNALFCAGTVSVIPKRMFTAPAKLIEYLCLEKIQVLIWAVSALRIVADFHTFDSIKMLPDLKKVFFSGEVMPVKSLNYWREFFPNTEFVNLYGPTEITCNCSYYVVDKKFAPDEKIPAGKPFINTRMFLLNEKNEIITDKNTIGEICVAGSCLSLGYWNNKEKTEECFVPVPGISEYPSRMYKTGDLGFYDEEMNFVFVSRKDYQIKHMGHRIELGEIEVSLNAISFIGAAVCIYDDIKEKIVCFYQAEEDCKKEIVKELSGKLPKYMWPNVYERREVLPLNKNGKIDRVKLKKDWCEGNG